MKTHKPPAKENPKSPTTTTTTTRRLRTFADARAFIYKLIKINLALELSASSRLRLASRPKREYTKRLTSILSYSIANASNRLQSAPLTTKPPFRISYLRALEPHRYSSRRVTSRSPVSIARRICSGGRGRLKIFETGREEVAGSRTCTRGVYDEPRSVGQRFVCVCVYISLSLSFGLASVHRSRTRSDATRRRPRRRGVSAVHSLSSPRRAGRRRVGAGRDRRERARPAGQVINNCTCQRARKPIILSDDFVATAGERREARGERRERPGAWRGKVSRLYCSVKRLIQTL